MEGRGWLLAAGSVALVLLSLAVCVCGGLGYAVVSAPDAQIEDERAEREGMDEGRRGTSEHCIVLAHDRTLACGVIDPDCTLGAQGFLQACLRAVPSPDPTLCDGVPAPSAMADWDFADTVCQRRGWASDAGECDPIADALSVHCHGR